MTVADNVRSWLSKLDNKAYAGILLAAVMVVSVAVFGIVPNQGLLAVNAFLSGSVWTMCLGIIVVGGHRVKAGYLCAACLIAGGLTTSIPSIFYEHTVVDWGSTVARLGLAVLVAQVIVDLRHKWTQEATA
jgi:hypothetical protein